jgi:PAS domain S-box-containing protein
VELTQDALHQIIQSIADPVFVKNRKHEWVFLNDACCQLIGHSRDELMGKSDYDFFPKPQADVFWAMDEAVFVTGEENHNEEDITDSSGNTHTISTRKTLYTDPKGQPFIVGVIRDITDHKRMEKSLVKLARAETEKEQLELFAYVASHDLREPLQSITGFSDLLMNRHGPLLDENGKGYLKRIQAAATRMSRLIDDLLKFSRVVKRAEFFGLVDLGKLIPEVLEDFEFQIKKQHAEINIGPMPSIYGDEMQIRQLFQNLISNALKFHDAHQKPKIIIQCKDLSQDRIEIIVEDNGIGIDEKYLKRIFKPFERLHSRSEFEGSGIGLAICEKIVSHHEGQIRAESQLGFGTTFYIDLPKFQHNI